MINIIINISQAIVPGMTEYFKNMAGGTGLFIAIISPYWVLSAWIFLVIGISTKIFKKKPSPVASSVTAGRNNDYLFCSACGKGYDESWKVCLDCGIALNKNPDLSPENSGGAIRNSAIK